MCSIYFHNSPILILSLVILILSVALTGVSGRRLRRVIGGLDAKIDDYPFVVEIVMKNGLHRCGGTLISNKHVLTGAHCVVDVENNRLVLTPPSLFQVISGHDTLEDSDRLRYYNVARIDVHKDWEGELADENTGGDIAVMLLSEEIPEVTEEKVAKLPKALSKTGDRGTIIGWGRTESSDDSPLSPKLQKADMTVIDYNLCRTHHDPLIPKNTLCALADDRRASFCAGDSGGPFINKDDEIFGVISYNWSCTGKDANIFTSVFHYKSWIEEILRGMTSPDSKVF